VGFPACRPPSAPVPKNWIAARKAQALIVEILQDGKSLGGSEKLMNEVLPLTYRWSRIPDPEHWSDGLEKEARNHFNDLKGTGD